MAPSVHRSWYFTQMLDHLKEMLTFKVQALILTVWLQEDCCHISRTQIDFTWVVQQATFVD